MAKSLISQSSVTDDDENISDKNEETNKKGDENSVCVIPPPRVSTPVSILIESLVKNICMIYENDSKKASIMYKVICDKLFQMNLIDESYNMNEFEGMRNQYQRAFLHLLSSALGDKALPLRPIWPNEDITNSHYLREFDEIEYIGGGGFGQVYRVRHKLDGTEYAVKKIPIRSEGIDAVRSYLSEVKTFASMNHTNIVQYKAAWLEIGSPSKGKSITGNKAMVSSNTHSDLKIRHIDDDYIFNEGATYSFTKTNLKDSSEFEITFERSIDSATKSSFFSNKDKRRNGEKRNSVSEGGMAICKLDIKEIEEIKARQKLEIKWATLYIQMALCNSTLKQWLEKRNELEVQDPHKAVVPFAGQLRSQTIYHILEQLLKGLQYIHSKGIVHHDIKPSNIFIQIENNSILVQLGDFGLACPLQSARHSLAFGTKLYAAPEQLAGKCNPKVHLEEFWKSVSIQGIEKQINSKVFFFLNSKKLKSDLYSVGIVLFELVENFCTDMERVQYITELRKGQLPPNLLQKNSSLAQIIKELVRKNPDERPSTSDLLNRISSNAGESEQIQQLKLQLAEKNEEILQLRELLESHGIKVIK